MSASNQTVPRPYSCKTKRGCPTCDGFDAKSCMRCHGKTRLCDWWETATGTAHWSELTDAEKRAIAAGGQS